MSPYSHFNIVLASTEVPFGYRMSLEGIKGFETYAHLGFSAGTYFISDIRCYRNTKRMIDYFADTMCFITLNWMLTIGFCSTCYLIRTQNDETIGKCFLQNKKSNKKIIYHKLERTRCLCLTFWVFTTSLTFGENRLKYLNDHWTVFMKTSIWNTLSMLKSV